MADYLVSVYFSGILGSTLIFTLVITPLLCFRKALARHLTAYSRHWLWYGIAFVSLQGLTLFARNDGFSLAAIQLTLPAIFLAFPQGALPRFTTQPLAYGDFSQCVPLWTILGWIWLLGAVVFLSYFVLRHLSFMRRVRRWSLPAQNERLLASAERAKLDCIKKCISHLSEDTKLRILICPRISGPMVSSRRWRPLLLLPREDYSDTESYYIFLHELSHWENGDITLRKLHIFLNALFWFHPLFWVLRHTAYRDMELSCDEAVLENADEEKRTAYCRVLLSELPKEGGEASPCTSYFRGSGPSMRERLEAIWNTKKRWNSKGLYLLITLSMLAMVAFGLSIHRESYTQVAQSLAQPVGYCIDSGDSYYTWLDSYLQNRAALPADSPGHIADYTIQSSIYMNSSKKGVLYLSCSYSLLPQTDGAWKTEYIVAELTSDGLWRRCTAYAPRSEAEATFPNLQVDPPTPLREPSEPPKPEYSRPY